MPRLLPCQEMQKQHTELPAEKPGKNAHLQPPRLDLRPMQPDLIVILIDDLRYDEFGAGGHPYMKTPHIDRLPPRGGVFAPRPPPPPHRPRHPRPQRPPPRTRAATASSTTWRATP